jgi:hypothetical protein
MKGFLSYYLLGLVVSGLSFGYEQCRPDEQDFSELNDEEKGKRALGAVTIGPLAWPFVYAILWVKILEAFDKDVYNRSG